MQRRSMKAIIDTDRLFLRDITLDDNQDMLRLHSSIEVQKYTGEPLVKSLEEMEEAIQTRIKDYKKFGFGRWATFLKEGNQFVGWAGLAYLPEFNEVDLGYRFLPEYWGMGIATEACSAILEYGFNELGLERIIAIAMKENEASVRVMEKAGMVFDKIAAYDSEILDAIWYYSDRKTFIRSRGHDE